METGKFLRKPKDNRTKKLSLLYDVPQKKLDRKLHGFFSKKKRPVNDNHDTG